ncbi:MAG: hypothetical protein LKM30_01050 [Bacilli bacterium]|jgi:hypothetical protein|nr:hypothetical protein [Bacilli bacterium]
MKKALLGAVLPLAFASAIVSTGFAVWYLNVNNNKTQDTSTVQAKFANDNKATQMTMTYGDQAIASSELAEHVSLVFDQDRTGTELAKTYGNGLGIKFVDAMKSTDNDYVLADDLDIHYSSSDVTNVTFKAYFTLDAEVAIYVTIDSAETKITALTDTADFASTFAVNPTSDTVVYQLPVNPVAEADASTNIVTINNSTLALSYADGMQPSTSSEYNALKAAISGKKLGFFFAATQNA